MGARAQDPTQSRLETDANVTVSGDAGGEGKNVNKSNSLKIRFPEHLTGQRVKATWKETAYGFGKHDSWKIKCEQHVIDVLRKSAPVKLLNEALKSVGW